MNLMLLDVAPDPVSTGMVVAVILFVLAVGAVLILGLVLFLIWRKRRKARSIPAGLPQSNSPNQ